MRKFYLLLKLFMLISLHNVWAQVLNPNDPVTVYNPASPPAEPQFGQIGKWVKTNRVSWNTNEYKAYIYKGLQFRLKWPKNYNSSKKYPMIIFLHGLGEKGSKFDNEYQLYHGGQKHQDKVNDGSFDGFLFYPQNTSGYFGPATFGAFEELINNFFKPQLNVDPYRIIVEGLSAGGTGTWEFMVNKPKVIAALGPISAANNNLNNSINSWKYTPIWWFQGGVDPNPAPALAQGITANALAQGANIKLTVYPGQGHGVWGNAWNEPDFFPFAMRAYKSNPWPLFGKTEFCPGDPVSVTMGLTAGFNQYQWRKDSVLIPGATSNTYTATTFGTYSARIFNGADWSEWSPAPVVVKIKAPTVSPDIKISGMMSNVLPTPAGSDSVVLEVPAGYTSYLWKKTTDAATLGTANKLTVRATGDYVVKVTEQFGCSSDFSNAFKVIPANGANSPDALLNLIATAVSRTQIVLNWTDKPAPLNNETAFEIYRSVNNENGYTLVAKVAADLKTYTDNNLSANTVYYYLVRPINNNGAATVGASVSATTQRDEIAPTAPGNLTVTTASTSTASLTWTASYDEVGVDKYEIYVNGVRAYTINGDQTAFLVSGLNARQSYSFVVRAKDASGNVSASSNLASAVTINNGLNYKYYTGTWSNLPNFANMTPVKTGNTATADISVRTQEDNFGFLWEGFINIPVTGNYTFETYSDDGSKLYIGNYNHNATALVNNDGAHGNQYREGTIYLQKGAHPIAITYFEIGGGQNMQVFWKNTAHGVTSRQEIPAQFFRDTITLADNPPAAPTNIRVQALSHSKLKVSWQDNSTNELGFEVYRSNTTNGTYSIVNTVGANVTSYTDTALSPATTYYYRVKAINRYGNSGFALTEYDGLKYDYYEASSFSSLPNFNALTPVKSGTVATVDITPRNRNEHFAMKYEGWLYVPTAGNYTFFTTSDAGSKLYIGNFNESNLVVSNDHLSGSVERSGVRTLTAGYHRIFVTYFEATGSRSLTVRYQGPGISKSVIPASAFLNPYIKGTTLGAPVAPAAPSALTGNAISPNAIALRWNDNASSETANEVYRSTSVNTTYTLLATLPANDSSRIHFKDSTVVPNTTYFYKVRAKNEGGNSAYSSEISVQSGNTAPFVLAVPNKGMRYETQVQLSVLATDDDGDPLTLSASNLPAFGTFTDHGNGSGTFNFQPAITNIGVYSNITVTAQDNHGGITATSFTLTVDDNFQPVLANIADINLSEKAVDSLTITVDDQNTADVITWSAAGLPSFATLVENGRTAKVLLAPGYTDNGTYNVTVKVEDGKGGEDIKSFVITVSDVDPNYKVFINFNDAQYQAGAPWYNTNKKPVLGDIFSGIKDESGRNTSITMQVMTPWQTVNGGANTNNGGYKTGNNSGIYPDNVLISNWWTQNVKQTIQLGGLDTSYAYNFTLFGSRNGISDNRIAMYKFNDTASVTNNATNNRDVTSSVSNIRSNASGQIKFDLDFGTGSTYAYLSSMVITAVYNDGKAPASARDLSADINTEGVRLTWTDRAFNEQNFRVHRGTSHEGPYTQIGVVNPNETVFADPNIAASTTYFYVVEAVNSYGSSFSDTIQIAIPNRAPSMPEIAGVIMKTDSVVNIQLTATDDPADAITFTATGLPAFAVLSDNHDGTGTLTLSPTEGQTGTFPITVIATDNHNLQTTRSFTVQVADKNINAIYVNFNRLDPAGAPWNSFTKAPAANASLTNLKDVSGTNTNVNIQLLDALTGDNTNGAVTGDNTGVYPDAVIRTYYYDQTGAQKRILISGLDLTRKYNLVFFGGRELVTDNRNTIYAVGSQSVTLNAASNTSNTVQINGLTPDASGNIQFTIQKPAGSFAAYLGALVIQSYVESAVPFMPENLASSEATNTTVKLTWTDKSSNETGFEIYRSTSRNGDYQLISTTAANATTITDVSLAANSVYFYKMRAKNGTNYSAFTEVITGSTVAYNVYFNFNTVNPAPAPWNNTTALPYEGQTMVNPKDASGNPTSFSWTMIKNFTGTNPAGVQTGNNSGIYPDIVMAESYYVEPGDTGKLKFTGLDQSKEYSFTFFGTRNGGGTRIGAYEINGKTVTLNANNNTSATVTLEHLVPDANGELLLKIYAHTAYGYLNAMVMTAYPKEAIADPGVIARHGGNNDLVTEIKNEPKQPEIGLSVEKVFPNPFNTYFNLAMQISRPGKVMVNLFDITGRMVSSNNLGLLSAGYYQQRIDVTGSAAPGVYMLQVSIDGKPAKTVKLIKQ